MKKSNALNFKRVFKKLIPVICLIPLAVGAIGYFTAGEMRTDSLYAAFALYFTNPVSDAYNGLIEFARWTAPLVTATAILCVLKNVWNTIVWRIKCLSMDSVAVYTDDSLKVRFDKGTETIYPGENFNGFARSQIILFSSDQKSLKFYEEHREQLTGKSVYIGLRELEIGLMREVEGVTFFDINGSIARTLWKEIALWNRGETNIRVAIWGDSLLAQRILSCGIQMNLFSKKQCISYHVISDKQQFRIKHPDLPLFNDDTILYHTNSEQELWDLIETADVVVVADRVSTETLQTIAVRSREKGVYYYSPVSGDAGSYITFGVAKAFGRDEQIFADENIRRQKLVQAAIALNNQYAEKYGSERDWNKLSGFLKSSNISSADFSEILAVLPRTLPEEELAELEHIRWCRFHCLNYWKKGTPSNGSNKDSEKRLHKDLVAYSELSPEEQHKNRVVVKMARMRSV